MRMTASEMDLLCINTIRPFCDRRDPESEVRPPRDPHGHGARGLWPMAEAAEFRSCRSDLAQPRSLHPLGWSRVYAALGLMHLTKTQAVDAETSSWAVPP